MPYYAKNNGVWVQGGKHLIKNNGAYVASDGYAKNNGVWSKYTGYTWERWSVAYNYILVELDPVWEKLSADAMLQFTPGPLTINSSTGVISSATSWITDSFWAYTAGNDWSRNPYAQRSGNYYHTTAGSGSAGAFWARYVSQVSSYSKGTTQYADVTDSNPDAYPVNGYQGGYWYVRK